MTEDRIAIYIPSLNELLTAVKMATTERPRRLTIRLEEFERVLVYLVRKIGENRKLTSVQFGKTVYLSERQAHALKRAISNTGCCRIFSNLEAAAFRRAFLDAGLRAPEHIFPVEAQKASLQHVQWGGGNQFEAEAKVQNERPADRKQARTSAKHLVCA
jgi:hypothetical protein